MSHISYHTTPGALQWGAGRRDGARDALSPGSRATRRLQKASDIHVPTFCVCVLNHGGWRRLRRRRGNQPTRFFRGRREAQVVRPGRRCGSLQENTRRNIHLLHRQVLLGRKRRRQEGDFPRSSNGQTAVENDRAVEPGRQRRHLDGVQARVGDARMDRREAPGLSSATKRRRSSAPARLSSTDSPLKRALMGRSDRPCMTVEVSPDTRSRPAFVW